jgi:exodeoxyribonuclease VII small subunit
VVKKKSEQYEEAIKRLQVIVEKMERGDLPLEEALESFSEGVKLVQYCHRKLEEAESKVQMLLQNQQGEWVVTPFDTPATPNSNQ